MTQEEYFEVSTYVSETDYVPAWRGNREAWKKGKPYFVCTIGPLNDSAFTALKARVDARIAEAKTPAPKGVHSPVELEILKDQVRFKRLRLRGNDGSVVMPTTGQPMVDTLREHLSNSDF